MIMRCSELPDLILYRQIRWPIITKCQEFYRACVSDSRFQFRGQFVNSYEHLQAVYSVACHPSSPEVVLTASEDGCVYIIDTRLPRRECKCGVLLYYYCPPVLG